MKIVWWMLLTVGLVVAGCRTGGHVVSMERCTNCAVAIYSDSIEAHQGKTTDIPVDASIPLTK